MESNEKSFKLMVFIGRFQPFHNGHLHVLKQALDRAEKVVLIMGSGDKPRTDRNPFDKVERECMIRAVAEDMGASERISIGSVTDFYDNEKWSIAVEAEVERLFPNMPRGSIGLIGHEKDGTSAYLRAFDNWEKVLVESFETLSATALRGLFFDENNPRGSELVLSTLVPVAVAEFLKAFKSLPMYEKTLAEFKNAEEYKALWSGPYPQTFNAANALLRCQDHVLLIKRAGFPNKGLWAIPGGFIEPRERVLDAALRELKEETCIETFETSLRLAQAGFHLADHPDRSPRGRVFAHVWFFDLNFEHLPIVKAGSDALEARWVPVEKLYSMRSQICEDHLEIMEKFISEPRQKRQVSI